MVLGQHIGWAIANHVVEHARRDRQPIPQCLRCFLTPPELSQSRYQVSTRRGVHWMSVKAASGRVDCGLIVALEIIRPGELGRGILADEAVRIETQRHGCLRAGFGLSSGIHQGNGPL